MKKNRTLLKNFLYWRRTLIIENKINVDFVVVKKICMKKYFR